MVIHEWIRRQQAQIVAPDSACMFTQAADGSLPKVRCLALGAEVN